MARICVLCRQPPREGQEMRPIRLSEDDLEFCSVDEVGLYSACMECVADHRKRTAKRLNMKPEEVSNNQMC